MCAVLFPLTRQREKIQKQCWAFTRLFIFLSTVRMRCIFLFIQKRGLVFYPLIFLPSLWWGVRLGECAFVCNHVVNVGEWVCVCVRGKGVPVWVSPNSSRGINILCWQMGEKGGGLSACVCVSSVYAEQKVGQCLVACVLLLLLLRFQEKLHVLFWCGCCVEWSGLLRWRKSKCEIETRRVKAVVKGNWTLH